MLVGILRGAPLTNDEINAHIAAGDAAPELPDVNLPAEAAAPRLVKLTLGHGCYGLAEGSELAFGSRLTLIYGENGSGKSSLARVLRAMAGRPSAARPLENMDTGAPATASLHTGTGSYEWHAGDERCVPHIEVFDSADTRVEGTEYQIRPRSVLALEQLRESVNDIRVESTRPSDRPSVTAELNSLGAAFPDDPTQALTRLDEIQELVHRKMRLLDVIVAAIASMSDPALSRRRDELSERGRLLNADDKVVQRILAHRLDELAQHVQAAEESRVDVAGAAAPYGVSAELWVAFLEAALPVLAGSSTKCPLCDSEIHDRHAAIIARHRAVLADQYATVTQQLETARSEINAAVTSHADTTDNTVTDTMEFASAALTAIAERDATTLAALSRDATRLASSIERDLAVARRDWQLHQQQIANATSIRTQLDAEREEVELAQLVRGRADELEDLRRHLTIERRRSDAQQWLRGGKTALTNLVKTHTTDVLESAYGTALVSRLIQFRVPRAEQLSAKHSGAGGQARRTHAVGGRSTQVVLSEGEQRALALADFAAELDTRSDLCYPVVIDDPVSSLDYRRLEQVVIYVRELVAAGRQVIVLTHSLWLAAELLRNMKVESRRGRHAKAGSATDYADVAIELVRGDGPLGTTVPIRNYVLGEVDGIAERISNVITRCGIEADDDVRAELISHGVGLIRAWCESYVEQRILGNAVSRLGWQVNPKEAALITPERIACAERLSRVHEQLHQRIAAHPQPGELGHRTMSLDDLEQLWREA